MSTYILRKGVARLSDLVDADLASRYPGARIIRVAQVNDGGQVGSDANDGSDWDHAFLTLQAAINKARYPEGSTTLDYTDKNRAKVVAVWPGHYNEGEILWSGYNLNIIGVGVEVPGGDYGAVINYDLAADSVAAFAFSGSGNSIQNLYIKSDYAGPVLYCAGGDNNLIRNVGIEGDGTNCTYGIQMDSMKGSRVEGCYVTGCITSGIYVSGGANHYFIDGKIADNHVFNAASNGKGIYVAAGNVCHNAAIDHNHVELSTGTSAIGIHVDATSAGYPLVTDNYVSVPASASPITHDGGDQYVLGNHTAAGTTNVDPNPAAG